MLRARIFFALELLLIISIVLVVLLPISPVPRSIPSRDSGVFLYTGWRVLHGEIPYLQVWDHKPPIIYYLDAFGLWLTPGSVWGVWWVEVFALSMAALTGFFLLKRLFGLFPAVFVSFLWLFSAVYLFAGGNLTTEYTIPFQFLLLFVFYRAENAARYGWSGFVLGVSTALLFFTRQNAVAIPLAIAIYLLVNRFRQRKFQSLFSDFGVIFAGGFLVTGIIVGYFALNGGLRAFWDTAFLYNLSYAEEKDTSDRIFALAQGLNQLENIGLAQTAFLGWGAALALLNYKNERIKASSRPLIWMASVALPIELLMVSIGGRPRIPYFLVLLPVFSIFAGFTFWLVFNALMEDIPKYVGAFLVFLLVISLGSVIYADFSEIVLDSSRPSGDSALVSYIQKNSAPDDFILVWGADSAYNFASQRASPTRFVYQTPLYNLKNKANVIEFLEGVLARQPRLIVLKADDKLSDSHFGYRDNQVGVMMEMIKALYSKPSKVGSWQVYHFAGQ